MHLAISPLVSKLSEGSNLSFSLERLCGDGTANTPHFGHMTHYVLSFQLHKDALQQQQRDHLLPCNA